MFYVQSRPVGGASVWPVPGGQGAEWLGSAIQSGAAAVRAFAAKLARRRYHMVLLALVIAGFASIAATHANTPRAALDLSRYKGKVVLLNFWTANCAECRSSFPVLEKLIARRSPDELVVIAVNLDHSRARADAALKQFGGHVSVFYDPAGAVAERYHLSQASGALLIDRSGRVRDIRQGGLASAANAFDARITELLAAE